MRFSDPFLKRKSETRSPIMENDVTNEWGRAGHYMILGKFATMNITNRIQSVMSRRKMNVDIGRCWPAYEAWVQVSTHSNNILLSPTLPACTTNRCLLSRGPDIFLFWILTCWGSLEDFDVICWAILGVGLHHADPVHHTHALADTAKYGVLAIQPLGGRQGEEELTAIGVGSSIGHGKNSCTCEFQIGMKLVLKLFSKYRSTAATGSSGVSSLDHKIFDNSMKFGAIVITSPCQLSKVFARSGGMSPVKLHDNGAHAGF